MKAMKTEGLLVSVRSIRMVEVDGIGAYARIELLIARSAKGGKSKPRVDIASFAVFAQDTQCRNGRGGETHRGMGGELR